MAEPTVTLREVLTGKTGAATRVVWNVADHPKTTVVGTKVSDQWATGRERAGLPREQWLEEVRAYLESQLRKAELPAADADGDIWYEVNTFTPI